jgi:superfamily II DNA/RNA helicase
MLGFFNCRRTCNRRSFCSFVDTLPLSTALRQSARDLGIVKLTKVQDEIFIPIAKGKSLIALAPTGTGKTFSYLLPMLSRMESERFGPSGGLCIIVVPTHELCQQVASSLIALDANVNLVMVYGKTHVDADTLRTAQVVIGTVGRVANLVAKGKISSRDIKIMVIDEFDSMTNAEYRKEISPLLGKLANSSTQIIGVGAVWSEKLKGVISQFPALKSLDLHELVTPSISTGTTHSMVKVNIDSEPARISTLVTLLQSYALLGSSVTDQKCIVFANSVREANAIVGHPLLVSHANVLHGDLTPSERDSVLNQFRVGNKSVLISTDLAARGIDVPEVRLVVSFRPPPDGLSGYMHRSGRTGRNGRSNCQSVVMYSTDEKTKLETIMKRIRFEQRTIPSHRERQTIAIHALVTEAVHERKLTQKRREGIQSLMESTDAAIIARAAAISISRLLGPLADIAPPKCSLLSGTPGYSAVLFVDPGKSILKSRVELQALLKDALGVDCGVMAASDSGYIIDLPTESAERICFELRDRITGAHGIEPVFLDKLPKIVTDEGVVVARQRKLRRKFASVWGKKKKD